MKLRDYQQDFCDAILSRWNEGHRYVLGVLPTGGGKTVSFAHIVKQVNLPTIVLAHRAELVGQMSLALAREGIRHRVIGPKELTRLCTRAHIKELGYSLYDPNAPVAVASVQSVESRKSDWYLQVRLWVHDEAHHLLKDNQFGRAVAHFPNAMGLGVTATPERADGKGLGFHNDGLFHTMIQGPTERTLIDRGFLSKYKIFAPPSDLRRNEISLSADGDFNKQELKKETQRSTVLGDAVEHYIRHTPGKLGLTFADSIENASIVADKFRKHGVPAEMLSGKTHPEVRTHVLQRFANREILEIVSVCLIDEGFDCPAVEVINDVAATESMPRFRQRFGRGLRPLLAKPYLIYFDHVGNVLRHGLPDSPRVWSLERREKRKKRDPDEIPLTVCLECLQPFERTKNRCPWCDHRPVRVGGGPRDIEFVDGDLTEIDEEILRKLRGEIARKDGDFYPPANLPLPAQLHARAGWMKRQENQRDLRNAIAWWAGTETACGYSESESYRRFYFRFGIDVANAQLLGTQESEELTAKVLTELSKFGIDGKIRAEVYFENR